MEKRFAVRDRVSKITPIAEIVGSEIQPDLSLLQLLAQDTLFSVFANPAQPQRRLGCVHFPKLPFGRQLLVFRVS